MNKKTEKLGSYRSISHTMFLLQKEIQVLFNK